MDSNFRRKYELLKNDIEEMCQKYELSKRLVFAVIMTESSGREKAYRYEPKFVWTVTPEQWAKKIGCDTQEMLNMQMSSYGLMQVMGANYYQYGGTGSPTEMYEPKCSIEYGCKILKKIIKRHERINDIYAVYNAGSLRFLKDGRYVNQDHVNNFYDNYRKSDFLD